MDYAVPALFGLIGKANRPISLAEGTEHYICSGSIPSERSFSNSASTSASFGLGPLISRFSRFGFHLSSQKFSFASLGFGLTRRKT